MFSPCFQNQVQTRALWSNSFQTNAGEGGLISVITKDVACLDTGFNSFFTKHCDCALFSPSLNFEHEPPVVKTLKLLIIEVLIFVEQVSC